MIPFLKIAIVTVGILSIVAWMLSEPENSHSSDLHDTFGTDTIPTLRIYTRPNHHNTSRNYFRQTAMDNMKFGTRPSDDLSYRRNELADHCQPRIGANNAPPPEDGLDNPLVQGGEIANLIGGIPIEGQNVDIPDEPEENFRQAHAENRAQNVNMQPNRAPEPQPVDF